jgi:hypothetical protein
LSGYHYPVEITNEKSIQKNDFIIKSREANALKGSRLKVQS